ncbi:MAG TPA: HepT-like ribonuclease domain-containing protein [Allosphingosinicella sp.]|nr:HepT-like ribonuclease domain-containing protein [Allosphingosinicella sp.]
MYSEDDRSLDWLEHIIENSDRIASYLAGLGLEEFAGDSKTRDAVERCIERITEAAIRLGPDRLAAIAPEVPLRQVRGLGNILRREYDRVNPELIWDTVKNEVPALRQACDAALRARGER